MYFKCNTKINKETLTTLRLYSQQWQDLAEIADKKETSVSQQIREAVEEQNYLNGGYVFTRLGD
ncbi:MAG: hypothetical protein ABIK53_02220 [bacterium]